MNEEFDLGGTKVVRLDVDGGITVWDEFDTFTLNCLQTMRLRAVLESMPQGTSHG